MFGLMVIGIAFIYFILWMGAVVGAYYWAERRGYSKSKTISVAFAAFLVMYLIPFWDHLPTLAAHKYYCGKEAGFWVYKTLDQWKAENPGVMEGLVANKGAPSTRQGDMQNYTDTYFLNQRFNWIVKHNGPFLFNRWRHEQEVVDAKSRKVLARYVDFSTAQKQRQAGWSGWKLWLENRHCSGSERNDSLMRQFKNNFRGTEK